MQFQQPRSNSENCCDDMGIVSLQRIAKAAVSKKLCSRGLRCYVFLYIATLFLPLSSYKWRINNLKFGLKLRFLL